MLLTQGAALGAVRDGSCGSRCPPRLPRRQRVLANVRALRQKAHGSGTEGWLDEAQRPRALTTFVSTQMAAAANKKAPPNATSTSPGQFDLMPKPLPRPFRFQRVTPGAKPLGATQSASPPAGLRRTGESPHVKDAEVTTLLSPNWLFGSQVKNGPAVLPRARDLRSGRIHHGPANRRADTETRVRAVGAGGQTRRTRRRFLEPSPAGIAGRRRA